MTLIYAVDSTYWEKIHVVLLLFRFDQRHLLPFFFLCLLFSDTDNELTTEVGGYQHVVVSKNSKVVDGDIVEALQQLPRGTTDGDCIHKVIHAT